LHLEPGEVDEDQLHLAHVRLQPQPPRLRRVQAEVERHVPVPRRHGRVVVGPEPVGDPGDPGVAVAADGLQAPDQVGRGLKVDGLRQAVGDSCAKDESPDGERFSPSEPPRGT
jgi:hypothetical protein